MPENPTRLEDHLSEIELITPPEVVSNMEIGSTLFVDKNYISYRGNLSEDGTTGTVILDGRKTNTPKNALLKIVYRGNMTFVWNEKPGRNRVGTSNEIIGTILGYNDTTRHRFWVFLERTKDQS